MKLTREAAERAMTAFAVVAARGTNAEAEPYCRQFLIACIAQLPREADMSETKKVQKIDASKENTQKMLDAFLLAAREGRGLTPREFNDLQEFLWQCLKRLPSQKAIDRDRNRKRKKSAKAKNRRKFIKNIMPPIPITEPAATAAPEPVGV